MKKYGCIMFDLDGTLLDTVADIRYNVNLTMEKFGFSRHTYEEICSFINDGAVKLIERSLPEDKRTQDNINLILNTYLEFYDKNVCVETTAYEGIVPLVNRLKKEGYTLCVVSNKPERHVKMLCDRFFEDGTFSYISGTGSGKPVKPDKACVDIALEAVGKSREELLYVGDSHVDIKTAHNAGVPCAGVTWGFHGKDGFKNEIPDFYADNTDELYKIISGDVNE